MRRPRPPENLRYGNAAMTATTFNPPEAARDLEAAGVERKQAEAYAEALRRAATAGRDESATKADLAELRADLTDFRAGFYRALWIQGGAIVAILTALRFLPI